MSLSLRLYTPEDYALVCGWWKEWGWPPLPESSLSQTGAIASFDGRPICAAWLYRTDSDLSLIEWFISDRHAKTGRRESLALLIAFLTDVAKKSGARAVCSTVHNRSLIRALEKAGFEGNENNMTNLVRTF